MISKRRGFLKISKELYDDINLVAVNMKVYSVVFDEFLQVYTISFTSPYLPEVEDMTMIPEYVLEGENGVAKRYKLKEDDV